MPTIADTSRATLSLDGDEVRLDTKSDAPQDCPKYRGSSPYPDGWLCGWSGDLIDGGVRREKVLFGVRHDDDFPKTTKAYEFVVFVQDPDTTDDAGMKCRLRVTSQIIEAHGQELSGAGPGGDFIGSGRYRLYMQGDGNIVAYDVSTTPWGVVWASGTQR